MRALFLLFCLLAATACDEKAPTGPSVPANQQFTLAPGETATIESTPVRVQFIRVLGDSRCPADAVCIQGGDAIVLIRVYEGTATHDYDLHTGNSQQAAIEHADLRIALVQVQPYPFSSRTIEPSEYRVTLEVGR